MIASLALEMGVLPSALLAEDADLLDALIEAVQERAKAIEEAAQQGEDDGKAGSLARRWAGVDDLGGGL